MKADPPSLSIDCAIVFGLAYAASLHAARAGEAHRGQYGHMRPDGGLITPTLDAITALRQWLHSRDEQAEDVAPSGEVSDER